MFENVASTLTKGIGKESSLVIKDMTVKTSRKLRIISDNRIILSRI